MRNFKNTISVRQICLFVLLLSYSHHFISQNKNNFSCSYVDNTKYSKCISNKTKFKSDANSEKIVSEILKQVGLPKNFILVACPEIENAIAFTSDDGIRYIIFDINFLSQISNLSSDWSKVSILAHEIGHHLAGHTLKSSESLEVQRQKELEADEFSGFILFKLGAKLDEALAAVNLLNDNESDISSTHPSKAKRINAIKTGFSKSSINPTLKIVSIEQYLYNAELYTEQGMHKEAILEYTKALQINPKLAIAFLNRSYSKLQINDYNGVIRDCDNAIKIDTMCASAYYNKGLAQTYKGEYSKGLENFNKGYNIDKSLDNNVTFLAKSLCKTKIEAESYFDSAYVKYQNKKYKEAIDDLNEAINLDRDNPKFYNLRGNLKSKIEQYDSAIEDLNIAISLAPENHFSYYTRGLIYQYSENFKNALIDFNKSLILKPNDFDCLIHRGYTKRILNDNNGALIDFTNAIKIKPNDNTGWLERGVTKYIMKKHIEAIADLDKSATLNSEDPYTYWYRGNAKISIKDKKGGCIDLTTGCELGLKDCCEDLQGFCK